VTITQQVTVRGGEQKSITLDLPAASTVASK
jgi:hypothetical protein